MKRLSSALLAVGLIAASTSTLLDWPLRRRVRWWPRPAASGVRRNTARTHLRSIFCKTGVTRQTMLVRLLLNSVLTLG